MFRAPSIRCASQPSQANGARELQNALFDEVSITRRCVEDSHEQGTPAQTGFRQAIASYASEPPTAVLSKFGLVTDPLIRILPLIYKQVAPQVQLPQRHHEFSVIQSGIPDR
jgi:hypothetical protein